MTKQARVDALMARPIDWPVPLQAVRMIAMEEDCRLTAYQCSAGVWTCGWGETEGVVRGMVWTQAYADERLRQSMVEWGDAVRGMLTGPYTDNELSALLSLSYNIGLAGLRKSSVLRLHNARDRAGAARAFRLWNKVRENGKLVQSAGLTTRRAREAALYSTQEDDGPTDMPQAVVAESSMARSPIAQGGAVTVAAGALSVLSAVSKEAETAATALTPVADAFQAAGLAVERVLGLPPLVLVGLLLVVVGYGVVRWRLKQREEGWA